MEEDGKQLCGYCMKRDDHCEMPGPDGWSCDSFRLDRGAVTEKDGWKGAAGLLMVEGKAKGKLQELDLAEIMLASTFPVEEAATPLGDWLAKMSRADGVRAMMINWERICRILEERIAS